VQRIFNQRVLFYAGWTANHRGLRDGDMGAPSQVLAGNRPGFYAIGRL
jgi:hypothetical protein